MTPSIIATVDALDTLQAIDSQSRQFVASGLQRQYYAARELNLSIQELKGIYCDAFNKIPAFIEKNKEEFETVKALVVQAVNVITILWSIYDDSLTEFIQSLEHTEDSATASAIESLDETVAQSLAVFSAAFSQVLCIDEPATDWMALTLRELRLIASQQYRIKGAGRMNKETVVKALVSL